MDVSVTVNGVPQTFDVEPRTLLVQFIREHARLTGTNIGCDTRRAARAPCTSTANR